MEELSPAEKRAYGLEPAKVFPYTIWQKIASALIAISLLSVIIIAGTYLFLCILDKFEKDDRQKSDKASALVTEAPRQVVYRITMS